MALRSQLVEDLGLKASERIQPVSSKSNVPTEEYECDVCHSILYISMVGNNRILEILGFLFKNLNNLMYRSFEIKFIKMMNLIYLEKWFKMPV